MKQLLAIILILCYNASASGMVLTINFCNEVFSYVSLDPDEETECCCSGDNAQNCCDKQVMVTKKADEHQRCPTYELSHTDSDLITHDHLFYYSPSVFHQTVVASFSKPLYTTPVLKEPPLYILHSVYRI